MKIKILGSRNRILWYADYIGDIFEVTYQENNVYWTREPTWPYALNWVYADDCIIVEETNEE